MTTKTKRPKKKAFPDTPTPSITLQSTVEGGIIKWRQSSARNKNNPDGLSLAAINMELAAAFGPQNNINRLVEQQMAETVRNVADKVARGKADARVRI